MRSYPARTHYAGTLTSANIGATVALNGWIASRRDLGGLIFLDVRDHTGIAQVVISPQHAPQLMEPAGELRHEFVVAISGEVRTRERINPNIPTGEIEIYCNELVILNRADTPPFEVGNREAASEELRLKYRYLDLRDAHLQRVLRLRSTVTRVIYDFFSENGFAIIETPIMVRATPEGARDYLVPSRIHPGSFYALPQSPQIYKQLLMVAGFDRYVQIAKCMRDEDLRADRQPEFTQIDLEMSFVEQEDVLQLVERMLERIWQETKEVRLALPIPRMPYREALNRFGSDKPDIRFGMELQDVTALFTGSEFQPFKVVIDHYGAENIVSNENDPAPFKQGPVIAGLNFSGGAKYSRKQIDELTDHVKLYGAKGLVWLKVTANDIEGSSAKFLSDEEKQALRERFSAVEGDMLLLVADEWHTCHIALGQLRLEIARREKLIPRDVDAPLFIVDFPMFEANPHGNRPVPAHHPFTSWNAEDTHLLDTEPLKVRANAYDLVINGYELASGSIRIHDRERQAKIFDLLGLTEEETREKFGFLLEAFRYGAPPHGGIAPGLDRLIMILAGTDNIRDVIAFPKTTSAASLMDNAPAPVTPDQLEALHLKLVGLEEKSVS